MAKTRRKPVNPPTAPVSTTARNRKSAEAPAIRSLGASIYSNPQVLPQQLVETVQKLETILNQEVWLLLQGGIPQTRFDKISFDLFWSFVARKNLLPVPE